MIVKDLKNILISMGYFFKNIFFRKDYDVVFVSSAYFNRGGANENILLKPMIDCCEEIGLKYIIFEDSDIKGVYKKHARSPSSIPFDFINLAQIILRKFFRFIYQTFVV